MTNMSEAILVIILLSVLLSLGSTRLTALVKIMALQGVMVSLIPVFIRNYGSLTTGGIVFFQVMIIVKGIIIPGLLFMAVKKITSKREVEPFIGYHASLLCGLGIVLISVFITNQLHISLPSGHDMILITAITTAASGLFLMMARRKAITQVIGYLMLENGIYLLGTALSKHSNTLYIVEFGVLLDLLVGVMIMGIILHNINTAFDDVDTTLLGQLKD